MYVTVYSGYYVHYAHYIHCEQFSVETNGSTVIWSCIGVWPIRSKLA
jgi:hypothetical protein